MFGLLEVNHKFEGIRFAIRLRNANDKSMRVGIVAGYRVFACDNMAFQEDFNPMLQKHSKNLDLVESVSMGVDRIQRQWNPLKEAITLKKETRIQTDDAKMFIYDAFTKGKFPVSLFKSVHTELFRQRRADRSGHGKLVYRSFQKTAAGFPIRTNRPTRQTAFRYNFPPSHRSGGCMTENLIPTGIPPFMTTVIEVLSNFIKWLADLLPSHSD